jgi:hypothetical protein
MEPHNLELITSYEPVIGWSINIYSRQAGYELVEHHRHVGGMFIDCGPDLYQGLSRAELLDVVDALLGRPALSPGQPEGRPGRQGVRPPQWSD